MLSIQNTNGLNVRVLYAMLFSVLLGMERRILNRPMAVRKKDVYSRIPFDALALVSEYE